MGSWNLAEVEPGTTVFVDASVFLYHFSGASADCSRFLERCETGELRGRTSVLVLREVAHRLMMIEAVSSGLVSPGKVVQKLRRKPDLVRHLHIYQEQVAKIPLMGIRVEPVTLQLLLRSAELRTEHGLLTNDSLVAAAALEMEAEAPASGDQDFARLPEIRLFSPMDLAL